jgi:predicted phage baseplate assembly protein
VINQSFTLAKSPLTYLSSGAGWTSTLSVHVDGIQWQEVPSFYGQGPDARVFVVTRSADQSVTTLTFGDGANGARLPTGSGNVVADYRYGSGAASPPAGRLTTIGQPQPNLAAMLNPVAVSGGTDPQSPDDVRVDAPASVATFGRAISASDYELVAARAPGVSRAAASWVFDPGRQRTLVSLWVGDDEAAVSAARAALIGAEDPNRPIVVIPAIGIELALSCQLVVAADQEVAPVVALATSAVGNGAGGLFSPTRMGIGQRLYRSAVTAALSVPGVVAVHDLQITGTPTPFGEFADPGSGTFFDLPPPSVQVVGVNAGA